jgi:hypothetical protein
MAVRGDGEMPERSVIESQKKIALRPRSPPDRQPPNRKSFDADRGGRRGRRIAQKVPQRRIGRWRRRPPLSRRRRRDSEARPPGSGRGRGHRRYPRCGARRRRRPASSAAHQGRHGRDPGTPMRKAAPPPRLSGLRGRTTPGYRRRKPGIARRKRRRGGIAAASAVPDRPGRGRSLSPLPKVRARRGRRRTARSVRRPDGCWRRRTSKGIARSNGHAHPEIGEWSARPSPYGAGRSSAPPATTLPGWRPRSRSSNSRRDGADWRASTRAACRTGRLQPLRRRRGRRAGPRAAGTASGSAPRRTSHRLAFRHGGTPRRRRTARRPATAFGRWDRAARNHHSTTVPDHRFDPARTDRRTRTDPPAPLKLPPRGFVEKGGRRRRRGIQTNPQ